MVFSMTGLGVGESQMDHAQITVELKSVNNRFLEISCRLPSVLSHHERDVREMIRKEVQRGKLYVTISIQGETNGLLGIQVDPEMTRAVHRLLVKLQDVTGVKEELCLDHYLKFSEIFDTTRDGDITEKAWEGVKEALDQALINLKNMRQQEGEALVKDIAERIQILEKNVDAIEKISKEHLSATHQKMVERVQKLIQDEKIDQDRLNAEIALLADKMDVTEECVRLRSHHHLFKQTLDNESTVGKKLNFLLQEINRETNTISSKAINAEISHLVVEMKGEIEKLREQVQNLE